MYIDPERNPDGKALHADHTVTRASGGTIADRLMHDLCNKTRGDGRRDHLRPALLAPRGGHAGNVLAWA